MNRLICLSLILLLALPLAAAANEAPDAEALSALVNDFLARADEEAAHQRLWADELVYTSSSGTRFGKADILAGFEGAEPPPADAPVTVFSSEDMRIQQYGDTAIVAFRLVGTTTGAGAEPEVQYYLNTGTFVRRDGEWRAVAWQATREATEDSN